MVGENELMEMERDSLCFFLLLVFLCFFASVVEMTGWRMESINGL